MTDLAGLSPLLADLAARPWIHRILVVVGWILAAKIADLVMDRVLARLVRRTPFALDDRLLQLVHRPLYWTLILLGILHANALHPQLAQPWPTVVGAGSRSLLIVLWAAALYRFLDLAAGRLQEPLCRRGTVGRDLFNLGKNLIRVVVLGAGGFWLLAVWQVDLTPLFASAGIAGIAVALAAKDTLANFFGGISIFADRTFTVGDYIIIDNNDRGEVVDIGIRSTRIKTRDDVLITIPNSILAAAKIVNESAPVPRFRIRVPVGVAYGSDLDQVQEVLLACARDNPAVVRDPAPRVRLRGFGPSSVDFELLCWLEHPALKGLETHNLLVAIYQAFHRAGITIPFPQTDIHLASVAPSVRRVLGTPNEEPPP